MQKKWHDIPRYEGRYQASNFGDIRSIINIEEEPIVMKQFLRNGKNTVTLYGNGYKVVNRLIGRPTVRIKVKAFEVGYLVALVFKRDTHLNERHVKHINGILTDNQVENLQWSDRTGL